MVEDLLVGIVLVVALEEAMAAILKIRRMINSSAIRNGRYHEVIHSWGTTGGEWVVLHSEALRYDPGNGVDCTRPIQQINNLTSSQ